LSPLVPVQQSPYQMQRSSGLAGWQSTCGGDGYDRRIKNNIDKLIKSDWKGYKEPPYTPSFTVFEFELDEATKFVRVYDEVNSQMRGQWFIKAGDIAGLTPKQIQSKFALPTEPKYVVDLKLPVGSKIRVGEANSLFGFEGKGVQFDMMGQYIGEWVNPRLLQ
jgi:hypothetical protein